MAWRPPDHVGRVGQSNPSAGSGFLAEGVPTSRGIPREQGQLLYKLPFKDARSMVQVLLKQRIEKAQSLGKEARPFSGLKKGFPSA